MQHLKRPYVSVLLASLFFAQIVGCGGNPDAVPTQPVSGTITLDGTPLTRGTVSFIPAEGPVATGEIQDGKFTLLTAGTSDGAVEGQHRVRIISTSEAGPDPYANPSVSLIPERYGNEATSNLTFDVKPGKNEFVIELTSTP